MLTENEKDSIEIIFEYICTQSEMQINYHVDSLRKVAHLIGMNHEHFRDMTGYALTCEEDNLYSGLRDLFKYISYEGEDVIDFYLDHLRVIAEILGMDEFDFAEYTQRPLYDHEPDWEDFAPISRFI